MRRFGTRSRLLFALATLAASGCMELDDEVAVDQLDQEIYAGWNEVAVGAVPGTIRHQTADAVWLGGDRFSVAYIEPTHEFTTTGQLFVRRFDVDAGLKGPNVSVLRDIATVRRMSNGPIAGRFCGFGPGMREYSNFYAIDLRYGSSSYAFLLRNRWCGNDFGDSLHYMGQGRTPAVALGKRGTSTKLLSVFGRNGTLYGQFADTSGTRIGREFAIASFPSGYGFSSTDVIWNRQGDRWIVGMVAAQQSVDCKVYNVRVGWDGAVENKVHRGNCDNQTLGHHTSIAYDDRATVNPAGYYAWWHQGGGGNDKGIHIMDANGNDTGIKADVGSAGTFGLTNPVDVRHSVTTAGSDMYVTQVSSEGFSFGLDGDANVIEADLGVRADYGHATLSLAGAVVYLFRSLGGDPTLYMSVSPDQPYTFPIDPVVSQQLAR